MPPRHASTFVSGSKSIRTLFSLTLSALALGTLLPANAEVAASAKKQMAEIAAIKHSLSPAEQKMSFNLVLLERDAQHTLPADLAQLVNRSGLNSKGEALVSVEGYLTPSLLSSSLMQGVEKTDGQVAASAFATGRVRARVAPAKLPALAEHGDVKVLEDPDRFNTNVGSLTSQGYVAHGAKQVIASGIDGTGVSVGVLSDSASSARVQALIATGDLPANVVVLPGQAGSDGEDEGTAMMEIVHDMAPGANLFFATAGPTQAQMAANIRALRFTYHCDMIVDDVTYFSEGAFQDDVIAKAVNDVTADGALYFSSAANSGNLTSGTSGTWEGDFQPSLVSESGIVHNFGTAASPVYTDVLTAASTYITLKWSDPLGGAGDDYDLYILDPTGTSVVGASARAQTGSQNPYEYVSGNFVAGDQVLIELYDGSPRALRVDTNRGQLALGTSGSTFGHNAAANTFTVAAVFWNRSHQGPKLFTSGAANPIETFSSDGLRKIFFNPNGTAITPNNFLFATNGGTTLQKPDGTAADGVTTRTPGFNPFYGTSAAAPHAAGIAALVKQANPHLTNTDIRRILGASALDNMAPGVDRDSGYGILMAPAAVATALAEVQ